MIGDVGQDEREEVDFAPAAPALGARRQLRLELPRGAASPGPATDPAAHAPPALRRSGLRLPALRPRRRRRLRLRDHRRLRRPRPRPGRPLRPLPLRRLLRRRHPLLLPPATGGSRAIAPRGSTSPSSTPSAKTPAVASTPSPRTDRSSASSAPGATEPARSRHAAGAEPLLRRHPRPAPQGETQQARLDHRLRLALRRPPRAAGQPLAQAGDESAPATSTASARYGSDRGSSIGSASGRR